MSEESSDQSNIDAGQLRMAQYQLLKNEVEVLGDVYSQSFIAQTNKILDKSSELLCMGTMKERTEHPIEQVLSSKIVFDTTLKVKKCTRNISGNKNIYDPEDLQKAFVNKESFWSQCFTKRIPGMYSLNSVLKDIDVPKEPKERRKTVKQTIAAISEPESVDSNVSAGLVDEVVATIKIVNKCYKNNGSKPMNYFELVINPESYKKTIENVFHMSCAIHEGYFALSIVDDIPHITPVSKKEKAYFDEHRNESIYSKFVFSLSLAKWKELIETFQLKEPMINIK